MLVLALCLVHTSDTTKLPSCVCFVAWIESVTVGDSFQFNEAQVKSMTLRHSTGKICWAQAEAVGIKYFMAALRTR